MNNFEPYTIEVTELAWVARALSEDITRPVLMQAALSYYDGCAVLVATDTYRIHLLRIGKADKEFQARLFNLRRVLLEARFEGATHVRIDLGESFVSTGKLGGISGIYGGQKRIHAPVFDCVDGVYPNWERVIPETKRPVAELFAIKSTHLVDATAIECECGCKTYIYSEGVGYPLVFRSSEDHWLAVIVPMQTDDWAKDNSTKLSDALLGDIEGEDQ